MKSDTTFSQHGVARYRKDNMVFCLAVYEWTADLDILAFQQLFEEIATLIGSSPDDTYVHRKGEWNGKELRYKNFIKRDIIHQDDWVALVYNWRRQPDARAYLAAGLSVSLEFRQIHIEIDEAIAHSVPQVYEDTLRLVANALKPTNGIGFCVPYQWGVGRFMVGQSGYMGPETDLRYDSREAFCVRGGNFQRVLIPLSNRKLDRKLRDIFAINLISRKHLDTPIEGRSLESWIAQGGCGTLRQLGPETWRWDVPKSAQPRVRRAAIDADLIADPFWTKLGWIDD
jgi:hypothetical protein